MRCSVTSCGKEGDGKFCEECGGKMVEEIMDTVVICSKKLEDESACGAELVPNQKFCKNCGSKVDQSLFHSMQHTCPKCGNVVEQGAKFCMECGFNLKQQAKTEQPTIAVNESEASTKVDADRSKEEEDTQTSTASKSSSETGTACLGESKYKDGSIQDEELYNNKKEESTAKNDESSVNVRDNYKENDESITKNNISSVHVQKIENQSDLKAGTVGQEVSFETQPNTAENSNVNTGPTNEGCTQAEATDDVEMADNQDGTINEEKDQGKIEMARSGNIKIINENSNSELSEQLKDVHIGKEQQGNLNVVETLKTDAKEENVKETSNDSSKDEDIDDDTVEEQSNDNGQVKRSKNQKENEKKRKQDTDTAEMQTEQEAEDDTVQRQDSSKQNKYSETGASSNEAEHTEQNIESCNRVVDQKPITDGEKGSQKNISTETADSEMVFGSHRSIGISESSGGNEIKTSFGKSLFTLKDTTDERTTAEQNGGNDKENNNESSSTANMDTTTDGTVSYTNDLDEENEETSKEGTDVDNVTKRTTRSMTQGKEQNKTNKQQSNKPKSGEKHHRAAERKPNEKSIKIQFHVLTSEVFKFEPGKDKCFLVMGNKEMGGWKRMDRLMKSKRKIEGYIYEMVYEEQVPTRLVSGGESIPYKYIIIKHDKPEKIYWEHYMKNYKAGEGYDRDLSVTLKLKRIDLWHQFDGFVEHEPKSWKDKFFDYFKWKKDDFIKHAEKAFYIFFPDLIENDKNYLSIDDIVLQLRMLTECMRKIYYVDGKCWLDFKEFSNCMGSYIVYYFMKQCNLKELQTSETREKKERATLLSMYFLYIMKALELGLPDKKSVLTISKAMLLEVNTDKKECPDLCLLDKYFSGKRCLNCCLIQ